MKSRAAVVWNLLIVLSLIVTIGHAQSSRPDFSGKWTLVDGDYKAGSPLDREGTITQDGSAVTFQSLKVPFDGSSTTRQDAFVWQYEGRWVGFAFVVSMKASSGSTPGNFTDLMIVSLGQGDTMTMVLMRTPKAGKGMNTYTLIYKRS